jgi:putative acetyltransferase
MMDDNHDAIAGEERAMTALTFRRDSLDSPTAHQLVSELNAELAGRYPEEGATYFRLDADEVAPGRGVFLTVWQDGRAIGCGALRKLPDGRGELKRMYVVPAARGKGVARQLLITLEDWARRLGLEELVLETGARQHEAIALYRRAGYTDVPLYGEYVDGPLTELSVCLGKRLRTPS